MNELSLITNNTRAPAKVAIIKMAVTGFLLVLLRGKYLFLIPGAMPMLDCCSLFQVQPRMGQGLLQVSPRPMKIKQVVQNPAPLKKQ